jgi:hypothetical protein
MGRKFGLSFSWRRANGLSAAKGRLSRELGVPLTASGRHQKLGRLVSSNPALLLVLALAALFAMCP